MTEPTYKRVCRVIAELSGFDADKIGPGMSLGQKQTPNFYCQSLVIHSVPPQPIGFDSLDLIQLAMQLEEEFQIRFTDDEVDDRRLDHVGGLVAFIQGKLDAKPRTYGDLLPALAAHALTFPVPRPLEELFNRVTGINLHRPGAEL